MKKTLRYPDLIHEPARQYPTALTVLEAEALLRIARQAVIEATRGRKNWRPATFDLPRGGPLREPGASFVTLHTYGRLHGCIGSVEPRGGVPLAIDVAKNAQSAALLDPRFPPLAVAEVDDTEIEVSVLSPMQPVAYTSLDDLCRRVRPEIDGVLVERGWQRGLLLPQVWEQLPTPYDFLVHVALKAGASVTLFTQPDTHVYVFQVHSYVQPAPAARQGPAGRASNGPAA
jgi:AmmeMemoRadiSam system protein A